MVEVGTFYKFDQNDNEYIKTQKSMQKNEQLYTYKINLELK